MEIADSILRARDFDIFFLHNSGGELRPVHCATFGSLLPEELNDDEYIAHCIGWYGDPWFPLQEEDIVIEYENVRHILGINAPEGLLTNDERHVAYIRTFVKMARKGLWSYDRYHLPHSEPQQEDTRFLLIAHPRKPGNPGVEHPCLKICNRFTLVDDYKTIVR